MKRSSRLLPLLLVAALAIATVSVAASCSEFGATQETGDDAAASSEGGEASIVADGGAVTDAPGDSIAPGAQCPEGGIVYNKRCYFTAGNFEPRSAAPGTCALQQGELAIFTSLQQWLAAGGIGKGNYWLGAIFDQAKGQWMWTDGSPVSFVPPGGSFDASPPPQDKACLWRDQRGEWIPTACSATSAAAYCERHL